MLGLPKSSPLCQIMLHPKRLIALDTETTGLYPKYGDRLISIGCVEILSTGKPGNAYHRLLNPERPISVGAQRVHGYSWEMLKDQPRFADIADEFLDFVSGATLVIHNARFDLGFLNSELAKIKRGCIADYCCGVLDTLTLARKLRPGQPASLDALCKAFAIDSTARVKHGALIDSLLLVRVYNALTKLS